MGWVNLSIIKIGLPNSLRRRHPAIPRAAKPKKVTQSDNGCSAQKDSLSLRRLRHAKKYTGLPKGYLPLRALVQYQNLMATAGKGCVEETSMAVAISVTQIGE